MTDLPRKAVTRTARLAALPLGYAGRSAVGLGKRLGGKPAEAVTNEIQQRTAEQLFRTLGELKGGAMKFGQALSVLESALPEEVAAPYREHLTMLQDSAPPMATQTVRDEIEADLGADWRERLVWLDGGPTAAASIGQVHRGRWYDGREVAVKVQYPGAGDALMGDLKQLSRLAWGVSPLFPGVDVKPLIAEIQNRAAEELDYSLEGAAQQAFADAFRDDPDILVPDVVVSGEKVLVTEWLESPASLARVIETGTRAERDHYGELLVRFMFGGPARTGMLHADPHPGNFRVLPARRRQPGPAGRARLRRRGPAARPYPATGDGHADPASPATRTRTSCSTACAARASSRTTSGWTRASSWTTWPRSWSRPASSGSGSPASGCASSSAGSTTRASRRTRWRRS